MRVLVPRLLAVLDPEGCRQRRAGAAGAACPSPGKDSRLLFFQRGSTGGQAGVVAGSCGATPAVSSGIGGGGGSTSNTGIGEQGTRIAVTNASRGADSARSTAPASARDSNLEDSTAFDLLHSEKGFCAFEQWYRRVLASGSGSAVQLRPKTDVGRLWPQLFCPPNAVHEHAFMELLRAFAECSDSEALDFFDLLDADYTGMLGLPQVYIAICLVAALGSRQLTKLLYFHSTRLFAILAKGCRLSAEPGRVAWPRVLMLLRLLGASSHLVSRVGAEYGVVPLAQLNYDEFLEVMHAVVTQLDSGAEFGESTVINESDRLGGVRSRSCVLL